MTYDGYTVDIEGAFDIMSCVTDYMCLVCLGVLGSPLCSIEVLSRPCVLSSTCASVGVRSPDAGVASRSAELQRLNVIERRGQDDVHSVDVRVKLYGGRG